MTETTSLWLTVYFLEVCMYVLSYSPCPAHTSAPPTQIKEHLDKDLYEMCQQKLRDFNLSKEPGFVWCVNQVRSPWIHLPPTPRPLPVTTSILHLLSRGVCSFLKLPPPVWFQFSNPINFITTVSSFSSSPSSSSSSSYYFPTSLSVRCASLDS